MIIRRTFPDLNLETMLPAIDVVIQNKYSQYPPQFPEMFQMLKSTRGIEQTTEVVGLGQMVVIPEGEDTKYDEPGPGFNKTYQHVQYSLGYKVSRIAMDDDQFGYIKKLAQDLGRSAHETQEIVAAQIFNQGFNASFPGPDGKALFATDHPLPGGAGTQTNRAAVAADPDVVSLQLALTDFASTVDAKGKKIRIVPKTLVVPRALEFVAAELLGGPDRPDTANHTINAFRHRSGVPSFQNWMVWDYLTDPHAWFIVASPEDTELRYYTREAFNVLHDVDFDSRTVKTAGWMRFSCGFNSFYGVYGVPSS
jgi:phage major head subunit gpT-like protein